MVVCPNTPGLTSAGTSRLPYIRTAFGRAEHSRMQWNLSSHSIRLRRIPAVARSRPLETPFFRTLLLLTWSEKLLF